MAYFLRSELSKTEIDPLESKDYTVSDERVVGIYIWLINTASRIRPKVPIPRTWPKWKSFEISCFIAISRHFVI